MNKQSLLRLSVVVVVLVTATAVFGLFVMQDTNDADPNSGGTKFGGSVEVSVIVTNETPFRGEAEISFDLVEGASPKEEYNNVYLCSYTDQGSVVHAKNLGTFTPEHEERNITLTADKPPKYVFVHHPDFYQIEGFDSKLNVFRDEHGGAGYAEYPRYDQLPFDPAKLGQDCSPLK